MTDDKPKTTQTDSCADSGTGSAAETKPQPPSPADAGALARKTAEEVEELGGPQGAEPARYGDWERNGRCSDF